MILMRGEVLNEGKQGCTVDVQEKAGLGGWVGKRRVL